jgi:hypothetical protein
MALILILTPQLPIPPQALTGMSQGTTIRNFNLIAGLAKRHDVDLLTFRTPALPLNRKRRRWTYCALTAASSSRNQRLCEP